MDLLRKTRAEINLDHIQHNLKAFQSSLKPGVKTAGVVKANGYGHDLLTVSELLLENGIDYLATATIQEAAQIRRAFPQASILVMGYTPDDHLAWAAEHQVALTIFSLAQGQLLSQHGLAAGKKAKVHVKVDTGFNRLGYRDHNLALEEITAMASLPGLELEGIFSHLVLENKESDEKQARELTSLAELLAQRGVQIPIKHICDSIGAVAYPHLHMDMVRLGALLYGYCSRKTEYTLKPALTLRTEVAMVKPIIQGETVSYSGLFKAPKSGVIATLPIGYADGLPRNIWQQGHVLVRGQRAAYAGLPCMDQLMVDVTGLEVAPGDEVILFGAKDNHELPLLDVANWCGTNRNELLTRLTPRVPRVFTKGGAHYKIID